MRKLFVVFTICSSLLTANAHAFFNQTYSARSNGMGSSLVSIDDPDTVFVNPAVIPYLKNKVVVQSNVSRYLLGFMDETMSTYDLGVSYKVGKKEGVGVYYNAFSVDSLYSETSIGISYARLINRQTSGFARVKQLRKTYGEDAFTRFDPLFANGYSKSALSFDCGVSLIDKYKGISISINNINQPDLGFSSNSSVPSYFMVSGHYLPKWKDSLVAIKVHVQDRRNESSVGLEKWIHEKKVGLRAGVQYGDYQLFIDIPFFRDHQHDWNPLGGVNLCLLTCLELHG